MRVNQLNLSLNQLIQEWFLQENYATMLLKFWDYITIAQQDMLGDSRTDCVLFPMVSSDMGHIFILLLVFFKEVDYEFWEGKWKK